jgi:hypothetical protein
MSADLLNWIVLGLLEPTAVNANCTARLSGGQISLVANWAIE